MDKLLPGQIHSYILRLWVEGEIEPGLLRASLALIPAGERIGFGDLTALFDYLTEAVTFPDWATTRICPYTGIDVGASPCGCPIRVRGIA